MTGTLPLAISGTEALADFSGALLVPAAGALVVADLHLEKGSALAARGFLLPPHDTADTLARLAPVLDRHSPRLVVALGDSFHDGGGPDRMSAADRDALARLQRGRDWVWVAGNHDPGRHAGVGGEFADEVALDGLTLRHEPAAGPCDGEVAGHLHPAARIVARGVSIRRRCFACDGLRAVLPAFGSYAGGLDVTHPAFDPLFDRDRLRVLMLGDGAVHAFPAPAPPRRRI